MTAREWKPGDVARVNGSVAVRTDDNISWWTTSGRLSDPNVAHVRPLVVIDPEDREAARRLLETYGRQFTDWTPELDSNVTRLQAALREFANPTPPKPAEPLGLGAVVEDAEGFTYVRGYDANPLYTHPWHVVDPCANRPRGWWKWDEITAVRVLSEGVTT